MYQNGIICDFFFNAKTSICRVITIVPSYIMHTKRKEKARYNKGH